MAIVVADRARKAIITARFNSLAERDTASQIGFTAMVDQGSEKLAEVLKAL